MFGDLRDGKIAEKTRFSWISLMRSANAPRFLMDVCFPVLEKAYPLKQYIFTHNVWPIRKLTGSRDCSCIRLWVLEPYFQHHAQTVPPRTFTQDINVNLIFVTMTDPSARLEKPTEQAACSLHRIRLRSFFEAQRYIIIDDNVLTDIRTWIVARQGNDGCFPTLAKSLTLEYK
ncbi:hypothetical protein TNCV_3045571 [Trichonephila clavipes]|nr:hypothetical protein TNCV_3045571 [Trichonephila clavipes]